MMCCGVCSGDIVRAVAQYLGPCVSDMWRQSQSMLESQCHVYLVCVVLLASCGQYRERSMVEKFATFQLLVKN